MIQQDLWNRSHQNTWLVSKTSVSRTWANSHSVYKRIVFMIGERSFAPDFCANKSLQDKDGPFRLILWQNPIFGSGTGQGAHPNTPEVSQTPISAQKQGVPPFCRSFLLFRCPHKGSTVGKGWTQSNSAFNLRHLLWFLVHLGSKFWAWTTLSSPPCGTHGQELSLGQLLLNQPFLASGSQKRKERPHISDMSRE